MKQVLGAIAVILIGCAPSPAGSPDADSGTALEEASVPDLGTLVEPRPFTRDGAPERDAAEPDSAVVECDGSSCDSGTPICDSCTPRCGDGIVNAGEQCDGDGLGNGGETTECDLECTLALCGDGVVNASAGETCDDGNGDDTDDCPDGVRGSCIVATCSDGLMHSTGAGTETDVDCGGTTCGACPGDLLLSEVAVTPTLGEFVEIENFGTAPVPLGHVYLADTGKYAEIALGSAGIASSDFVAHFPLDAVAPAGSTVVVSLESATAFYDTYGRTPDYDLDPADPSAPDLVGVYGASSGLTNSHEMIVLFAWDGLSDTVRDLDYLVYGDATDAVDKTSLVVNSTPYAQDTPVALQVFAPAPDTNGETLMRCDPTEGLEPKSGGNGWSGHDETGENLDVTWVVGHAPSPGAPNPCP